EQGRVSWRQAHARESALETVITRFLDDERKAEDRQEQAEMDERAHYRRVR
ncbi:MAG: flagellar FliJ family protein, partial [Rhodanobacter sp.]